MGAELRRLRRHGRTRPALGIRRAARGVVSDAAAPPGSPRLDPSTLALLAALLAGDWATADAADERTRAQASGVAAAYTQFHLERGLRSLEHVDRTIA
nr:DNA repair protein RecO C-terminal domain-containing protein [Homoserinibacter gongjuensis]